MMKSLIDSKQSMLKIKYRELAQADLSAIFEAVVIDYPTQKTLIAIVVF